MTATRGERLRAARKNRFKSARAAALAMGVPISTYGAHERAELPGGRDYGADEAKHYARRLRVTPEWLLTGLRQAQMQASLDIPFPPEQFEEPRTHEYPVMGYVGAGTQAHYYDVEPGFFDGIERPDPDTDTDKTIILEVRDHGLGSFFDRWVVFFGEIRQPVTPDLFDFLCVAGTEDGRLVMRWLQPGRTEGKYDLMSEFGEIFLDVSIVWAAKVTDLHAP
jgi:hypothetical protein